MISVLGRNIRTALEQKATAAFNSLRIKSEISKDHSITYAKLDITSREEFQNLLKSDVVVSCKWLDNE
jgi:BMFP domain-containing protein YqiC